MEEVGGLHQLGPQGVEADIRGLELPVVPLRKTAVPDNDVHVDVQVDIRTSATWSSTPRGDRSPPPRRQPTPDIVTLSKFIII